MSNRTHSQIINDVGVTPLREKLRERGIELPDATVRAWPRREIHLLVTFRLRG